MIRTCLRWLCLGLLPAFTAIADPVVINEIMYHPTSTNLLEQWVEVYNTGTNPANLSGWTLQGDVQFTFPTNTTLGGGAYLVVAADQATFTNHHPGVANVVAGWVGTINNSLKLDDNLGQEISSVKFANEGDWAIRVMGALDAWGRQGWEWLAEQDGLGKSLELINPGLPTIYGQNWGASTVVNGTPGQANSLASTNIAPLIVEVGHTPIIPQPADVVTVSARILDEHTNGLTVTLNYRVDGVASFTTVPMFDDGAHGDGLAGDGIYSAILPARANTTIVEFYLQARDLESNLRTYPNYVPPGNSLRTANLLYQVDNGVYTGDQPIYRIIMTELERSYLQSLSDTASTTDSDANMNATWISVDGVETGGTTTQLRYNVGVRNRGHGSRTATPHNYHVNFVGENPWKNVGGINLNSQFAYNQLLGSAIFRRTEMPMADSRAVQVRVNSVNLPAVQGGNSFGSYAANQQYDNDFIKGAFPLDPHGNSYRGIRNPDNHTSGVADLSWQGSDYTVPAYANTYFKQNNEVQNDWSDLINLIGVLNVIPGYSSATGYIADVQRTVNVDEWMKYMAVNTLLDNQETSPGNGIGDDYALYRGALDTRFLMLSYDMDTIMGTGSGGQAPFNTSDPLFRMLSLANGNAQMPVLNRFMTNNDFAPLYFKNLKSLCGTIFAPAQMNVLLDQLLGTYVPTATLNVMKNFNAGRVSYVLSQIPSNLTVTSPLSVVNGYPRATTSTTSLSGLGNAIDTRTVLVNNSTSSWTAWQASWSISGVALLPGINKILVQALGTNGLEIGRTNIDIWYDNGSTTTEGGTLSGSNFLAQSGSPYVVSSSLNIGSGAILRIEPGTTVYFAPGVSGTISGTGKLLAEGTAGAHIRIGHQPGSGNWASLDFLNATVESRLAYVDFDGCGGSTTADGHNAQLHVNGGSIVFIDHCAWPPTPVIEYISFNGSSFIVQNCFFPTFPPPTGPESLHGINGIGAGGYGIFRDNYFGHTWGFNDTIDFTGGQRQGAGAGPILQVINNVFDGASDDCLDLDSTDAWIEGNIFLHVHRDPTRTDDSRDTASAISGGVDFANQYSDWTLINNIFFDVDHVFLNKNANNGAGFVGGGRVAMFNNTVVHVNKEYSGSPLSDIGAFDWSDDGLAVAPASVGSGLYAANNIIYDCAVLNVNYFPANYTVIMDNNILSVPWAGPGNGNQVIDPHLNLSVIAGIPFTNVTPAQARLACQLLPGSPAIGAGFGGQDLGGLNPHGIIIAGAPSGTTTSTNATLTVGFGGTFDWGTWPPQGWGWTAFKWKLDDGAWSSEIPVTNNSPFTNLPTINLTGLSNGQHTVYVVGRNDAPPGYYQDDTFVYPTNAGIAARISSRTWTVDTSYSRLLLNEILTKNNSVLTNAGTTPDLVELYNSSLSPANLAGMGLTDDPANPYKFTFPEGATNPAGGYLVLYADSNGGLPGIHLGFTLKPSGGGLYLYASTNAGGALLDSIVFGIQLADVSIGRLANGSWGLCKPTFGSANIAQPTGSPRTLKINEWLTDAQFVGNNDFIELYNPDALPVPLGGLYLSDASGAPGLNQVPALSFIAASGFTAFTADGNTAQGADHVNFKLSPDVGMIVLSAADLSTIDIVNYGSQHTDISQGRLPNGGDTLTSLALPTPGGPNPSPASGGGTSITNITTVTVPLLNISSTLWAYDNSGTDYLDAWRQPGFDDSSWSTGFGLFGFETTPNEYLPYTFQTYIPPPNNGGHPTVYYRAHFFWDGSLTNYSLIATNYLDDGAVYYINGQFADQIRITANPVLYSTLAQIQNNEGIAEIRSLTNPLLIGDNIIEVEVHQQSCCISSSSSDDVFGMALTAISSVTNITVNASSASLVLNEVLANTQSLTNSDGRLSNWVELFNPSTNNVSLFDLSLSDDPALPRRWVFPTNVTIGANSSLVVYLDPDVPASTNNTLRLYAGFALKSTGEGIFLFNRLSSGGGLLDAINFGLQTPDFSIGRVPDGVGNWVLNAPTPGGMNVAAGLGSLSNLKVNEWMADPASGSDWFEIYNAGNQPVALGGLYLTDNLNDKTQSPIPPLSFIGSGNNGFIQFFADGDPGAGADHVKFNLKKSGESVGIFSSAGVMVDGISFGAQATGVSQGRLPDGSANIVSFVTTPSPAERNYLALTNVAINEVLSHIPASPGLEDAIELFNPTDGSVDVSGWFLSNSKSDLFRFRIPDNTVIQPGGFVVLYEIQFNPVPGVLPSFGFSAAHGEDLVLSAADVQGNFLGYRTDQKFGAAEQAVSFGRYLTSIDADFVAMSQRTFGVDNPATVQDFRTGNGLSNAAPKVGPLVINEIMYHPPPIGTNDDVLDEFIELKNITGADVPLFDPSYGTNTWRLRNAVDFEFPTNSTLAAGAYLLVVSFDPATNAPALASFLATYSLSPNVPIFGPYRGKLDNGGETIELQKPDAPQPMGLPDAGFVPYILVEHVKYSDSSPWPYAADGFTNGIGFSLQRRNAADYGNDPVNWLAGAPTPAAATGPAVVPFPSIVSISPSQTVPPGTNLTLLVSAIGNAPLTFQWRLNGVILIGATNSTLAVNNVQEANTGIYSVLVNNAGGTAAGAIRLDLALSPTILRPPQNTVAPAGGMAIFTVSVRGASPLTFQWQKAGNPLAGATNATLTLTNVQSSDETNYNVVVTNPYGQTPSASAALSLSAAPVVLVPPQSTNVFVGATVVFSVSANGGQPLRYQWFFQDVAITNATNTSYTIENTQLPNAGTYKVRVANTVGNVFSSATLTVIVPPTVSIVASDASAAEAGLDPGAITISRTGNTSLPLTVLFTVSGTATPGSDYVALASPVTLQPGAASTNISVIPLDDLIAEAAETVIVTLSTSSDYAIGSPSSATVTIADNDNIAPSITITNPANGAAFAPPVNIAIGATASDIDGFVAKVDFYFDATNKLGSVTAAPYVFIWTNALAGTHVLTAIATDNLGGSTVSAPVNVSIKGFSDNFGNRGILTGYTNFVVGTNIGYTLEPGEPTNGFSGAYTAWISWTAPDTGTCTVSTTIEGLVGASNVFDTVLTVFTGTALNNLTRIALNDDDPSGTNGLQSKLSFSAVAGTTYQIQINSFSTGEFGTFYFRQNLPFFTTQPKSTSVISGSTTNMSVGVTSIHPLTYQWYFKGATVPNATNSTIVFNFATTNIAGPYFVVVSTPFLSVPSSVATLTVIDLFPGITTQPHGGFLNLGASASLSVVATNVLTYQWFFNGASLATRTNSTLPLTNVQGTDSGQYFVVVSSASHSLTSVVVTVTVRVPPSVAMQPRTQIVDPGSNAVFNVTADGLQPFTYQWLFNDNSIQDATNSAYTVVNAQHTNAGNYSVTIFNDFGSAGSDHAELIVRPQIIQSLFTNGAFRLTINGTPGKIYTVESATNTPSWAPLGSVTNPSVQVQYLDPTTPSSKRLYRLRLQQ